MLYADNAENLQLAVRWESATPTRGGTVKSSHALRGYLSSYLIRPVWSLGSQALRKSSVPYCTPRVEMSDGAEMGPLTEPRIEGACSVSVRTSRF